MLGHRAVYFHHNVVGAKIFFQPAIGPFCRRSNFVAFCFMGQHWNDFFATSFLINDRCMSKLPTYFINPFIIVGGIHQVIQVGDFVASQLDQRDGNLAIMYRSRGNKGTDRQARIVYIQVQLVAIPRCPVALGIFLGASVTFGRQFLDGLSFVISSVLLLSWQVSPCQ